ncbi:hypothetical protein F4779DRAFT_576043 [Xylariaceae sp. FL0662B]|nr:hypothetical protein F4779DRAFT_576043 [Xylariaceae sp. FL0662B]
MVDFLDNMLPDECARMIWAQLQPKDLRAVMRVSPTWARSATPFFYRAVDIPDAAALGAFLRTIQQRPDLAAFVRHLRLHQHASTGPNRPQPLAGPAASLLRRLPALRELQLEERWSGLDRLISSGRLCTPLMDLRNLSLGRQRQPMSHILPFWALPKVESIRVCIEALDTARAEAWADWPTAPTLAKLDLDYTSLEEKDVTPLLRHSPALKSFRYDRWCKVSNEPSLQDCDELGRGLRHLRPTLEHLDLRVQLFSEYAEEVDDFHGAEPVRGHLPSLRGFDQLRTLCLPVVTLLGWTPSEAPDIEMLLPPSLQRLSLTEDLRTQCMYQWTEESVLAKLDRYFATLGRSPHKLEAIDIYPDGTWGGWLDETMEKVQEMAAAAGVQCNIVDWAHRPH